MILQNQLNNKDHGYAQLLIADYHLEYPLIKPDHITSYCRVELVWYPRALTFINEDLGGRLYERMDSDLGIGGFADQLFPNLESRYNGHYEHGMNLWLVQGDIPALYQVWERHLQNCMIAPSGDDDTYDYWPNAMDMLIAMAQDIGGLTEESGYYFDKMVTGLIALNAAIVAVAGPMEKWEAGEYATTITTMTANRKGD